MAPCWSTQPSETPSSGRCSIEGTDSNSGRSCQPNSLQLEESSETWRPYRRDGNQGWATSQLRRRRWISSRAMWYHRERPRQRYSQHKYKKKKAILQRNLEKMAFVSNKTDCQTSRSSEGCRTVTAQGDRWMNPKHTTPPPTNPEKALPHKSGGALSKF